MARILVIDDERIFPAFHHDGNTVVYARTSAEAIALLDDDHDTWDEVWFDHDLGPRGDARKVMTYLEERRQSGNPVLIEAIYVHSMNPVGASELVSGLSKMYPTRRVPLPWKRTTRPGAHHAR